MAAREADLPPVRLADRTAETRLLVEAREDAVAEATRVRNRLHADLVVIAPGTATVIRNLVSQRDRRLVAAALRGRAGVQVELARARLARLRVIDREVAGLEARITALVGRHPLLGPSGVGVITAARLIAETGDVGGYRSIDAFAMLAGVAPIPASSGQVQRMRLNRGGNRQLNRAFCTIATVQAAHHPPAQAFLSRKAAEHKSGGDPGPQASAGPDGLPAAGRGALRGWHRPLDKIGACLAHHSRLATPNQDGWSPISSSSAACATSQPRAFRRNLSRTGISHQLHMAPVAVLAVDRSSNRTRPSGMSEPKPRRPTSRAATMAVIFSMRR